MIRTLRRWSGQAKFQAGQALRVAAYRFPTPWSSHIINEVWEDQANAIHQQWGHETHDFATLQGILAAHRTRSILDVGCGSGRLFGLYLEQGIHDIVGLDIAEQALALARLRYPQIQTIHGRIEDLQFPPHRFDLAVCNRVLQHVPSHAIAHAVARLCAICRHIYVNELAESDQLPEEFFMFRHDYAGLFAAHDRASLQQGRIGRQTYQLFG
jgi:SAM-dependent methyltransferase